jgi:putative transposase
MDDSAENHAKFLLLSHLIFVCKYRKKLLIRSGNETKKLFEGISAQSDISFETVEVDQDHIHCLVKSEPRISPLAMVQKLKQESTIRLWQVHKCDLERLFWSDGSFCGTIGNASQETMRHSIESQG